MYTQKNKIMSLRASHVMSSVPTSCMQVESTVLPVSIDTVWPKFRALQFDVVAPTYVTSTEIQGEGVGSIVKVTYKDETVWELRVTEISVSNNVLNTLVHSSLYTSLALGTAHITKHHVMLTNTTTPCI